MKKILILMVLVSFLSGCGMSTLLYGPGAEFKELRDAFTPTSDTDDTIPDIDNIDTKDIDRDGNYIPPIKD